MGGEPKALAEGALLGEEGPPLQWQPMRRRPGSDPAPAFRPDEVANLVDRSDPALDGRRLPRDERGALHLLEVYSHNADVVPTAPALNERKALRVHVETRGAATPQRS